MRRGLLFALVWAVPVVAQAQMAGLPHGIPNFCAMPTISSVTSGAWSNPATWLPARLPVAGDRVSVASGTVVTYDVVSDAALACVATNGTLQFKPDSNTRLTVGTLMAMEGGRLEVGTAAQPIAPTVTAEIVIANQALNTTTDPEQYGTGVLGFGAVVMHGSPRTPTFLRVSAEPLINATTLALSQATTGWRVGDRLVVPDTRQLDFNEKGANFIPQWEVVTVTQIAGSTVTITPALRFNHIGARDVDGTMRFLPHVGNLSRNTIVRSQTPTGTRGHVLMTHRASVDMRYVLFKDLGRTTNEPLNVTTFNASGVPTHIGTNQIGRYALHMHHLSGPVTSPANGYQFTLTGNAIDGSTKWGIGVHNAHYGLVSDNVVYDTMGAGIISEDGSESFNVIERNLSVRCIGIGGWAVTRAPEFGIEGAGFWFRGPNNVVRDNVAADSTEYGFVIAPWYLGVAKVPAFQGADVMNPAQMVNVDMNAIPIREFARNEAYGATTSGLTVWWIGAFGDQQPKATADSVIKDFRVWHVYFYGLYGYPTDRVVFDGLVMRGVSTWDRLYSGALPYGVFFSDYMARNTVIMHADIQGFGIGIMTPTLMNSIGAATGSTFTVESSYLRNYVNILDMTMWTVAGGEVLPPKRTVVRDTLFADAFTVTWSGQPQYAIQRFYVPDSTHNVVQRDDFLVESFNRVAGDNFSVFYTQQAPSFIVPMTGSATPNPSTIHPLVGSPEAGLTNTQNWAKYHLAIAGGIAPCTTTRLTIGGFVCPSGVVGPVLPSAPTGLGIRQEAP